MPANLRPVQPMTADRHLDLNADLHYFFDTLFTGAAILDVGAGLGRSKVRIRHNRVSMWDPSPFVSELDFTGAAMPEGTWDVLTAFEVLEHVERDEEFLRACDQRARFAVFLTTPNWAIKRCDSRDHYREYTQEEFLQLLRRVWPFASCIFFAYFKDAEGGWVEYYPPGGWLQHPGLKHVVLVLKRPLNEMSEMVGPELAWATEHGWLAWLRGIEGRRNGS